MRNKDEVTQGTVDLDKINCHACRDMQCSQQAAASNQAAAQSPRHVDWQIIISIMISSHDEQPAHRAYSDQESGYIPGVQHT